MRKYFFSYFFQDKRGRTGYGHISINRSKLIQDHSDLEGVMELICERNKFKQVSIISWRRYEQPEALIGFGKFQEAK